MKGANQFLLRTIIYATALAMLVACDKKRPEGVLTQAQMVEVMGHIYITEEKVNQLGVPRDSAKKISFAMSQKVFEDAGVRDSVFKKSFDYFFFIDKEM